MPEDQRDTVAFLSNPVSYGVARVEIIETHISQVFLAGDRAYKLKRAVALPYVDFSTVDRRRRACEQELALNRRTAPELYLATRPVCRTGDGCIRWGTASDRDIVDWLVVMRRFPPEARLDVLARAEGLPDALLYRLAAHIADFHAGAGVHPTLGGAAAMTEIVRENDACLRAAGVRFFPLERIEELLVLSSDSVLRLASVLDRRRDAGKVRRCHGDLHLRNIYVIDGVPKLFDCLEFSEALACIDVLYDLAFLLMDLSHQSHANSANLVFNRYLDLALESDGLVAMPLFISLRAAIRAHVTAVSAREEDAEAKADARRYLCDACAALRPAPARLVAIGGLSGTGKSTLAATLAPALGVPPGARVLRSDVARKRLFGLDPEAPLPETAYSAGVTARVYEMLCKHAAISLGAGYCTIIDAVAVRPEERAAFADVAAAAGVRFDGVWLRAPRETMLQRVTERRHDASDADAEVVLRQIAADAEVRDWRGLEAGGRPTDTERAAREMLGL